MLPGGEGSMSASWLTHSAGVPCSWSLCYCWGRSHIFSWQTKELLVILFSSSWAPSQPPFLLGQEVSTSCNHCHCQSTSLWELRWRWQQYTKHGYEHKTIGNDNQVQSRSLSHSALSNLHWETTLDIDNHWQKIYKVTFITISKEISTARSLWSW